MLINHDTKCALDSVVDLINTAPSIAGHEALAEVSDLRAFVEPRMELDDAELTQQCEQAIRSYDPCISCATHFLDLTVERS